MALKRGLGRGLDALFSDNTSDAGDSMTVRISALEPNRAQPRKDFDPGTLRELADSIAFHGLMQPILVRPLDEGRYQIVAGERRWRACRLAGLSEVPVIVRDMGDEEVAEAALVENLQREDLNPLELAHGYKNLMETCHLTQEEVAERVGKHRTSVTNSLRLLQLNEEETAALRDGKIKEGHARTLLAMQDPDVRKQALSLALSGASVRELEALARAGKPPAPRKRIVRDPFYTELELAARETLRRTVKVRLTGQEKGTLEIPFYSREDLREILRLLETENQGNPV